MNKNFVKYLSRVGFFGSWYVSFLLNCTLAKTKTDYIIAFIFTSVMQYASFYFFVKRNEHKNYIFIACVLFGISILGTMSYQMSVHNQASNESVKNSTELKNHKQVIVDKENQVQKYENEKLEIDTEYESQIVSIETIRDNRPTNHYTKKNEDNKEINRLKNERDNKKSPLDEKIFILNEEISKLKNTKITSVVKETKGYLGISTIIADWLDWKSDTVTLIIQFLIAVTFEGTAVMLHIAIDEKQIVVKGVEKIERNEQEKSGVDMDHIMDNDKSNSNNDRNNRTLEISNIKKKSSTEIKTKLAQIDDIEIKKYRNMMEQTSKNGICIGYARISKLAGLTTSKGRQIFEYLKQIGIIQTTEKGTIIRVYQRKVVI